jgi:hypothetical protein
MLASVSSNRVACLLLHIFCSYDDFKACVTWKESTDPTTMQCYVFGGTVHGVTQWWNEYELMTNVD